MPDVSIEKAVSDILERLGEDPAREGLAKTPQRVARALEYLTKGYREDPRMVINGALFVEEYSEMIVLKDIDFFSLCEHHILPFFGTAHVAYIPKHRIVGIHAVDLVWGLGTIHCLTQQEPAARSGPHRE